MKFSDFITNSYVLAISSSYEIQSKTFDRSVNTVTKTPLSFNISDFPEFLDHQ